MKKYLRARHLLCVIGRTTEWHTLESREIIHKMYDLFIKNPHGLVELGQHCDSICSSCSYCILNTCQKTNKSSEEFKEIDQYIFQRCLFEEQVTYRLSEVIRRLFTILTKKDIQKICSFCKFKEHCLTFTTFQEQK